MSEDAADVATLAAHLGVCAGTVYRKANAGALPGFRVGNRWRFFVSEVDAFLTAPKDPWIQSAQSRGRKRKTVSGN